MTAGILHSITRFPDGRVEVGIKPKIGPSIFNMIRRPKKYHAKPGLIHEHQKEGVLIEFYANGDELVYIYELPKR